MELTINSTGRVVQLDGIPARLWQGKTPDGAEVILYVTRVQLLAGDPAQFERDLQEHEAPRPEVLAIPLRLIL